MAWAGTFLTGVSFFWLWVCVELSASDVNATEKLKLGLIGAGYFQFGPPFALADLGSALPIALDELNNSTELLPNHTLSFVMRDSDCDPRLSVGHFVTLVQEERVDAIIGPTCAEACESLAYLASHWNIPVISYTCWSDELSNKLIFDTFARTFPVFSESVDVFETVLQQHSWQNIAVMQDVYAGQWQLVMDAIEKLFPVRNISIAAKVTHHRHDMLQPGYFAERLQKIAQFSRGTWSLLY